MHFHCSLTDYQGGCNLAVRTPARDLRKYLKLTRRQFVERGVFLGMHLAQYARGNNWMEPALALRSCAHSRDKFLRGAILEQVGESASFNRAKDVVIIVVRG